MRALVTGGAGFIGTNLIKRLVKEGHDVISVDNYDTGKREHHQDGCSYNNFDISKDHVPYSRLYWSKSAKPMGESGYPDVIFHLAALPRIQPSFEYPKKSFESNVLGTQNILEWSRNNGKIPVVYAGSSSKHGDLYLNPYTFTKWQGEELCKLYSEVYKVPTSICRFYNVYGEYQETEGDYCCVLAILENQYQNGEPLTITWDGEQRRDFTHVDDIVDGLMRCSEHFTFMGEEFELGFGKNYSINEVADAFGKDYPREYIDRRPGEMLITLCTDSNANKLLDWEAKTDIIDYVQQKYKSSLFETGFRIENQK